MMKTRVMGWVVGLSLLAHQADAVQVDVTVTGQVIFNGIQEPPLSGVGGGSTMEMTFSVDSNNFVDGVPGDTRGYIIDGSSFAMTFEPSGTTVGLADPFPVGETPYFTLVDGFPVSDGFFVSTFVTSPGGVPLSQDPFNVNLDLGYVGTTLDSLDILDAVGDYDFAGLTRFGLNLWAFSTSNVAMEMDFASMSIVAVPEPSAWAPGCLLGLLGIVHALRRHRG
ncbi:MAG: hypothetical protein AAGF97_04905 [Planctomycetota bacterium]